MDQALATIACVPPSNQKQKKQNKKTYSFSKTLCHEAHK